MEEMEKQVSVAVELFNKVAQIWTMLEEDEKVQQWDHKEERVTVIIQYLKKRKNK
jgi:hypothetical protein